MKKVLFFAALVVSSFAISSCVSKKDLEACLKEASEAGDIKGEVRLEYKYDLQSFFNYFDYFIHP